jgi:hypothetical protein
VNTRRNALHQSKHGSAAIKRKKCVHATIAGRNSQKFPVIQQATATTNNNNQVNQTTKYKQATTKRHLLVWKAPLLGRLLQGKQLQFKSSTTPLHSRNSENITVLKNQEEHRIPQNTPLTTTLVSHRQSQLRKTIREKTLSVSM